MKLSELIEKIEYRYPPSLQYEWDNCGLNVGNLERDIKKIILCLEVSSDIIDTAVENNVDLIISHHPFLFSKINRICSDDIKGSLIYKAIKNDISIYCMHTSFDVAEGGLNDYFMEKIGLEKSAIMDPIGVALQSGRECEYGLGKYATLKKPVKATEFVEGVKTALGVEYVRFVGDMNKSIETIGVVTGSGAEYFELLPKLGIDLLITGDMKYHQAMDAKELGVCVADFGHYGTEHIFPEAIRDFISDIDKNIEIMENVNSADPFTMI